jgi:hypothetical protein
MVFARAVLASGPGTARNSFPLSLTWSKVKVGKKIFPGRGPDPLPPSWALVPWKKKETGV